MPTNGLSGFIAASNFGLTQATLCHSKVVKERERIQDKAMASLQYNLGNMGSSFTSRFINKLVPKYPTYTQSQFQTFASSEKVHRLFQQAPIASAPFDNMRFQLNSMINSATELQRKEMKKKFEDKSMVVCEWQPPTDEHIRLRKERSEDEKTLVKEILGELAELIRDKKAYEEKIQTTRGSDQIKNWLKGLGDKLSDKTQDGIADQVFMGAKAFGRALITFLVNLIGLD